MMFLQFVFRALPQKENVVDISDVKQDFVPDSGKDVRILKEAHENGCISWGTLGAHAGSIYLDEVLFVEDEVI